MLECLNVGKALEYVAAKSNAVLLLVPLLITSYYGPVMHRKPAKHKGLRYCQVNIRHNIYYATLYKSSVNPLLNDGNALVNRFSAAGAIQRPANKECRTKYPLPVNRTEIASV